MKAKISIIMPVYNAEKYLRRSIESVQNQTYENWELFIVDDGSTDNSVQLCQEYIINDERIKIIFNNHGGAAKARNTALDIVDSEYIAFLDADDAYHPKYLQILFEEAQKSDADIVVCWIERGTDASEFLACEKHPHFEQITMEGALALMYQGGENRLNFIGPCTKLYKNELFKDIRFPEGRYFEDAATMNLTIYKSHVICITRESLYFYNHTPNSASSTNKSAELWDREWAFRSHWEKYLRDGRGDLVKLALPFYLVELVDIYHRMESSDHPEERCKIREVFDKTYKKYKRILKFSKEQNEVIIAFRHPTISHLKSMVKNDGLGKTIQGFIKRKFNKIKNRKKFF